MPADTATYPQTQRLRILTEAGARMRERIRVAKAVSSIMLASVVLLILILVVGMALGAWRFTVIDTGSMRPTINPGDVAVLTSERPADLRVGQIVAFHPPHDPHLTVIHRVFALRHTREGVVIRTKGDANNATDSWDARIVGNTVWHEDLKVAKIGYLAAWSQQRPVRLGLLVVVVTLVVTMLLGSIWRPRPR
jgi:signal peptidase